MKKHLPLLIGLASVFSLTCLAGCKGGGGGKKDTPETLEIYIWNGGYGTEWLTSIIEEFKKQDWVNEKYPNLDILSPIINDVFSYADSRLSMGSRNTIDLLFTPGAREYFGPGGEILELTDAVYNQKVPGEEIIWKDKADPSYNFSNRYTDKKNPGKEMYYCVAWAGGMGGIVYNETILNDLGIKVPNTTDELVAACAAIKAHEGVNDGKYNKGYSFIQSYDAVEYFEYLFPLWWSQYEGMNGYINFYSGIDGNRYSKNIFNQQGRKYALDVFDSILSYDKGYLSPASFRYEFMQAQLLFLQGNGVFHANGDWLDNEMRDLAKEIPNMNTFKTMRTPIISQLGVKLGITDSQLSQLVDYIDGNGSLVEFESTTGYSDEEVIDEIKAARGIVQSIGPTHQAVIPSYAEGKEVAVDFLRFMATDIALEAYTKATGGNSLPFKYNVKEKNPELYQNFSTIQQSRIDYFTNGNYELKTLPHESGFPLYTYSKLLPFIKTNYYETFSLNGNTKKPDDFMQETIDYWTDEKWARALRDAGLSS